MDSSGPDALATAREANDAGMAALKAGQPAAAMAAFQRATRADPGALPLWRNLAHASRLAGDTQSERAALNQALSIDRLDFGSQLRLAQLLQRENEESAALIAWNNVRQLAASLPDLPDAAKAEVAAGIRYSDELGGRLRAKADDLLGSRRAQWNETEQRRINAFVDRALGRRSTYQNECAGLYFPFLPADEYFDRHHFPWLDELEAHTDAIHQEFQGILAAPDEALRPYVRMEEGSPESKWTALDGSLDWSACFLWEYGRPNQPVLDRCPVTAAVLERLPTLRIPGRGPSAFFSSLRPHSAIPPHTGVTNVRAIVHLALDIPEGCGFRVGGETREWVPGKAFAFDDTIDHEAWNRSGKRRSILILDVWNPHLTAGERDAIAEYFVMADTALN